MASFESDDELLGLPMETWRKLDEATAHAAKELANKIDADMLAEYAAPTKDCDENYKYDILTDKWIEAKPGTYRNYKKPDQKRYHSLHGWPVCHE